MKSGYTVVIASGYFDPLHVGHVEYLKRAKGLGALLWVIVNNKPQAHLKKSYEFMPQNERCTIIEALDCVDRAFLSIDDNPTVSDSIRELAGEARKAFGYNCKICFAKGGDRHSKEIPEKKVCDAIKIDVVDGLGEKIQSSSSLVNSMQRETTHLPKRLIKPD